MKSPQSNYAYEKMGASELFFQKGFNMINQTVLRKAMGIVGAVLFSLVIVLSAPIALAGSVGPCVKNVAKDAICVRDINECGNASLCQCPRGYEYSAAIGKCTIEDISLGDGPGVSVKSKCAKEPQGICTQDINACGHASACECPDGFGYSPIVGQCLRDL